VSAKSAKVVDDYRLKSEERHSMTQEVQVGGGLRARIWLYQLPKAQSPDTQSLQERHRAEGRRAGIPRAAAIELLFIGGRTLYGLLGATFTPQQSSEVNVTVCYDAALGPEFERPLAFGRDDCRIGLLPEYAPAIMAAVALQPGVVAELGGGELRFDHAVHGRMGSSYAVFQRLTSIVLMLLTAPLPLDDEAMVEMIRGRFSATPPEEAGGRLS